MGKTLKRKKNVKKQYNKERLRSRKLSRKFKSEWNFNGIKSENSLGLIPVNFYFLDGRRYEKVGYFKNIKLAREAWLEQIQLLKKVKGYLSPNELAFYEHKKPSVPLPSVPLPSIPLPSVPLPSVPLPSVPLPSVPLPSVPLPFVPLPSVRLQLNVNRFGEWNYRGIRKYGINKWRIFLPMPLYLLPTNNFGYKTFDTLEEARQFWLDAVRKQGEVAEFFYQEVVKKGRPSEKRTGVLEEEASKYRVWAADAKLKEEADAKLKEEADAKLKEEADAKLKEEADAKLKEEADAKLKEEVDAKLKEEADAKLTVEERELQHQNKRRKELAKYKRDLKKLKDKEDEAEELKNAQENKILDEKMAANKLMHEQNSKKHKENLKKYDENEKKKKKGEEKEKEKEKELYDALKMFELSSLDTTNATLLKKKYYSLAKLYHSDKNNVNNLVTEIEKKIADEKFKDLNNFYTLIKDKLENN